MTKNEIVALKKVKDYLCTNLSHNKKLMVSNFSKRSCSIILNSAAPKPSANSSRNLHIMLLCCFHFIYTGFRADRAILIFYFSFLNLWIIQVLVYIVFHGTQWNVHVQQWAKSNQHCIWLGDKRVHSEEFAVGKYRFFPWCLKIIRKITLLLRL